MRIHGVVCAVISSDGEVGADVDVDMRSRACLVQRASCKRLWRGAKASGWVVRAKWFIENAAVVGRIFCGRLLGWYMKCEDAEM